MHDQFEEKRFVAGGVKSISPVDFLRSLGERVTAFGALAALSPVMLLCALLVRFSSPGKILFKQNRVGRNGKTFSLYKFRTMFTSNNGLPFTAGGDSRITTAGKFLRKTKLDELPQLYNIVRGEMSFVGPRPEVVELVNLDNPLWQEVLSVRPGITDPVTLQLRNEETLLAAVENKTEFYNEVIQPYKLNGYAQYVRSKSLPGDIKIIAQTFKAVLFPNTALHSIDQLQVAPLPENDFVGKKI